MQNRVSKVGGQLTEVYTTGTPSHIVIDKSAKQASVLEHPGWCSSVSVQEKEAMQYTDIAWLQQ
jgi:hypothetical protein